MQSVKPYGVFVSLAGFRRNGLVPHHQVSDYLEFSKEDTDEDKYTTRQRLVRAASLLLGTATGTLPLALVWTRGRRGVSERVRFAAGKDKQSR